jgi:K+-transporting ATPase ATPase C chain
MLNHLRSGLLLLVLTLVILSVLYPLTLLGIAQIPAFHERAEGSLIVKDGKVIGSKLIAQQFTADEYFQPRPSAAGYNGMASGASNYAASNYLLRDRVARALGPIARYGIGAEKFKKTPGTGVQDDIENWFAKDQYGGKPGIVAQWAENHAGLGETWIKSTGDAVKDQWKAGDKDKTTAEAFVLQWQADLPELFNAWIKSDDYRDWKKDHPGDAAPAPADMVKPFFMAFSRKHPGEWLVVEDYETKDKQPRKRLSRVGKGADVQSVFFDMWRQEHADVPLEQVPADMVTASGSGLDPHITLDNARYQLKTRIAAARARKIVEERAEPSIKAKGPSISAKEIEVIQATVRKNIEAKLGGDLEDKTRQEIDKLLESRQETPHVFSVQVGVPLINVLEMNINLDEKMAAFAKAID